MFSCSKLLSVLFWTVFNLYNIHSFISLLFFLSQNAIIYKLMIITLLLWILVFGTVQNKAFWVFIMTSTYTSGILYCHVITAVPSVAAYSFSSYTLPSTDRFWPYIMSLTETNCLYVKFDKMRFWYSWIQKK